jgi:hypothetical protein
VLRKRLPGEAPLPRPVTAAELSTSEAIDASEGESIAPTAPAPKPAAPRPAAVAAPAPPAPRPARRPATEPQAAPPPADQGPRDLLPKP